MTFLKLFLLRMFKDPNLAENFISLVENKKIIKKFELRGVHEVCFFKVWIQSVLQF